MAVSPSNPVDLVIRLSTGDSDLVITINDPRSTSGLALKQRIRSRLRDAESTSRLRLIHAGKVISDTAALGTALHVTPPPPVQDDGKKSDKARGKQAIRDGTVQAIPRVYIHCAIGDALTTSELEQEAQDAALADDTLRVPLSSPLTTAGTPPLTESMASPAPQGFDRLLSAGFSPAEVASLRTRFLAIQAHTHTPDTMPSGPELLALEERWLDSGSNTVTAGAEDTGGFGGEDVGGLEDMLYGNLIGFFWPIGAICWMMREEGVWTRRRQIAVLSGFLVNLTFGFLRVMN